MNRKEEAVKHVILAESDDDDHFFFSLAIQEVSCKTSLARAEDGAQLTRLLHEKVPDVLFLSLQLRCGQDQDCLRAIRRDTRFDHLPIVIYSSLDDPGDVDFSFREGSNLFVVKPTTLDRLATILERILGFNWNETMYFPQRSEFVMK